MKKSQRDETERKKFRPLCSKEHALRVWMTQYSYFFDRSNSNPNEAEEIEKITMLDSYDDANFLFHVFNDIFKCYDKNEHESQNSSITKFVTNIHNGGG